ncbi:FtsK/SpoIIIE domain-containing protein [Ornithinimicrobium sp. W1679]|uniref:FtsK/SpoIIIE domain-containing protein n=1 Tax=Ornithinimicrobium sp. W1679 TaxID=3418770 RepID=UPI003CEDED1E
MITVPACPAPRYLVLEGPEHLTPADVHALVGAAVPPPAARLPLHGYAVGPAALPPATPLPRLVVADGPDAGACVQVAPGASVTVGRDPSCDLTVLDPALSRWHVRVAADREGITVEDLGSTNGMRWSPEKEEAHPCTDGTAGPRRWVPGHDLLVGGSRLTLRTRPGAPLPVRWRDGRAEVRPWPRTGTPRPEVSLSTPAPPQREVVRPPSAWSWGLPLAASVALAVVLRMPFLLLFGLMAPAMVLGHHLGERRRTRTEHRDAAARHDEELLHLEEVRRRALADDLTALRAARPGLGGVVTAVLPAPSTDLWSRAHEPLEVVLGRSRCPAGVRHDGAVLTHGDGPVTLDLEQPLAVVGPAHLRDGLVRSVLLQAATTHPPSALRLLVDPVEPPGDGWDLLAWLPHTRPASPDGGTDGGTDGLRWGEHLCLVDDVRDAPAGRPRVEVAAPGQAVLRRPGEPDLRFEPTMLGLPLARRLARLLAGCAEDVPDAGPGPLSRPATLGDLARWPTDTDQVRRGWSSAAGAQGLSVPLGIDARGTPVVVDLVRDGPHALVAGTTGSGKSELLRTLVTGLALAHPPSRLGVLLMDYKGGSSLGQLSALPHAVGLVTDLDPHLGHRVLESLRAELRRRERELAQEGLRDVSEGGDRIPRLLIVVDEFRVLAEELPDFLSGLVRVATVGRSLGVHLVLATQRPGGVVSPDLRANVNLRIALRVREVADSLDVLDVPDAAQLPEGRPGAGLLRTGASPARSFQTVQVGPPAGPARSHDPGSSAGPGARPQVTVQEVADAWAGWRVVTAADDCRATAPSSDLSRSLAVEGIVEVLRRTAEEDAARSSTPVRARPVWHPPLPDRLPVRDPGAWAVADRPEQQSWEPLTWRGDGHVALVGAPRSGRSTAARSLVAAAGDVWLYVVDPAGALAGSELSAHPGLRAWVGPGDPAHATAVLRALVKVVDRRLAAVEAGAAAPVVLVVDGWDRWVQEQEADRGQARELATRVLRDGPSAGVCVVLTGDRQLVSGTVGRHVPQTWLLPTHDPTDVATVGLRPAQVPRHRPAGRAVRASDGLVAQVHLPVGGRAAPARPPGPAPPRLVTLPRRLDADGPWAVGGERAEPVPRPTGSVLVLGPPGSGVTSTLGLLTGREQGNGTIGTHEQGVVRVAGPGSWDDDELRAALDGTVGTVVLDEAHLLTGSRTEETVLAWADRTRGRLLVGGELTACSALFRGVVPYVGRLRTGLVLQPSLVGHGAPLAVDLPTGDLRVPGRGVLVVRGRCTRVQVRGPSGPPDDP